MSRVTTQVPLVAGLAYRENLGKLTGEFTAMLKADPGQPYHPHAIAVYAGDRKIGYVAPEIARHCYQRVADAGSIACPARRSQGLSPATGVEATLDLSALFLAS